jgi:hypothetical protein
MRDLHSLLLLLLVVIVIRLRRVRALRDLTQISPAKALVCLTVVAHVLYYTIVIGGDHFEYRVFSQLVLLIFITFLWLLNALRLRAKAAALLFSLFIVLSWPIPWLHWSASHNRNDRRRTAVMGVSVARALQRSVPWTPAATANSPSIRVISPVCRKAWPLPIMPRLPLQLADAAARAALSVADM